MTNEKDQNQKQKDRETARFNIGDNQPKSLEKKQKNKTKTERTMGGRICKLRLNAGMTQEQLAEKLFTSSFRISRLESDNQKPICDELILMCELFGTTADYIIRGIENPPANLDLTPDERQLVIGLLEKLKHC